MRPLLLCLLCVASVAHAKPGTRALPLEIDREAGRLVLGDLNDRLPLATLRAEVVGTRVLLLAEVPVGAPAPTRWSILVEHVNPHGFVTRRDLPILGPGLPPLAIEVERPPEGVHLRARLVIDCGRFEGAESPPVYLPALLTPAVIEPPSVAMIIDGKEARLPIDQRRLTFDLDVPATVTLKVRDALGVRWVRRAISAREVRRPAARKPPALSIEANAYALRAGHGMLALPELEATVLEAASEGDKAWVRLLTRGEPAAWRVRVGATDPRATIERVGVGAVPKRLDLAIERSSPPSWIEVETQSASGLRSSTGRVPFDGATRAPRLGPMRLRWVDTAVAGLVTRVGTATGAYATLSVPEDF